MSEKDPRLDLDRPENADLKHMIYEAMTHTAEAFGATNILQSEATFAGRLNFISETNDERTGEKCPTYGVMELDQSTIYEDSRYPEGLKPGEIKMAASPDEIQGLDAIRANHPEDDETMDDLLEEAIIILGLNTDLLETMPETIVISHVAVCICAPHDQFVIQRHNKGFLFRKCVEMFEAAKTKKE